MLVMISWILGASCAARPAVQASFRTIGVPSEPKTAQCAIDIFRTSSPSLKYIEVSRIDIHLEYSDYRTPHVGQILPLVSEKACISGADAVMDFHERQSILSGGIHTYHITATGIRYE